MPDLPPVLSGIAVMVIAGGLYGLVWYVTRGLAVAARVLARVTPVIIILPGLLYLSVLLALQREEAEAEPLLLNRSAKAAAAAPAEGFVQTPRSAPGVPAASPVSPGAAPARRSLQPGAAVKSGDAGAAPVAMPGPPSRPAAQWDVVPVLYGTDRLRQKDPNDGLKRVAYGPERARRLELGRALVTVPVAHQVPAIERPFAMRIPYFQVVVYEQAEDPKQHFTVRELQVLPQDKFLALARERLGTGVAFKDQALVFVHGYNTGFDQALYRTAQIAYDLKFDGAAFLYSWPAAGALVGYAHDRESATQAEPYLKDFLRLVVQETGAKAVSVIAHSMGNLPLLNVLHDLGPSLPAGVRLNELILAAPDVDRDVFANLIAGIKGYGRGITLYCSANDRAMVISRQVAGGVPRAGDVPRDGPVVLPGVDTIDVSATSTDLLALNHSAYAERSALLNDIGLILQTGERPPERRIPILQKVTTAHGDFWRYP